MTPVIESPDGSVVTSIELDDGRPTLAIYSAGTTVIEGSPFGIHTFEESFVENLSIKRQEHRTLESKYETPAGKRRTHHTTANESTLTFATPSGEVVSVDLRVSNDGVAYRYRLTGRGSVLVTGEESAFRVPKEAAAWLMPYEKKHENIWQSTSAAEAAGEYSFPSLFEVDDQWVLLTEADVDGRYTASRFSVGEDETLFRVCFSDSQDHRMVTESEEVSSTLPLATPWRVAIVGDLSTVVESDLVADVVDSPSYGNDPCCLTNTSWIEPGRVAWSWWSDGGSTSDYDTQREYVEYAAEQGWEYVLVDDGWESEWLPDLVAEANERGVEVLLWSRWSDLNTDAKRSARLSRWQSWGVAGLKVDFMNSDAQDMMTFYDDLAAATADHELLLNVHGSITPKGLRRRWPHLLTYEGVYGAENYHPVPKTIPPEHNVILPYTRNVIGPMDYTPVTFSAETRSTTAGHELALSVVFETGLQHFADSIESYSARPLAEEFLKTVPAAWDETLFVDGYPGQKTVIARRRGNQWFLGCIAAGPAQTVEVPCAFLSRDERHDVTIYRDGEGDSLTRDDHEMNAEDDFSVRIPENSGFGAIFTPQTMVDR